MVESQHWPVTQKKGLAQIPEGGHGPCGVTLFGQAEINEQYFCYMITYGSIISIIQAITLLLSIRDSQLGTSV